MPWLSFKIPQFSNDDSNSMSAVLYKYTCASCSAEFEASGAPEMSYGEFILRTESGEEAYLEAVCNGAFSEVSDIVEAHPSLAKAGQNKVAGVIQKVFGVVCDPSPKGHRFHIEMKPTCPACKSREMASWEAVYPLQLSPIPSVTQTRWALLGNAEKADIINRALGMNDEP